LIIAIRPDAITRAGAPSLAPMYDVMCGGVWENVTKNLAQKIAGEGRGLRQRRNAPTTWLEVANLSPQLH
jgi:hypothetical protein